MKYGENAFSRESERLSRLIKLYFTRVLSQSQITLLPLINKLM